MWSKTLRNSQGERLDNHFTPGGDGRQELVVIGHGVTSDRDRPWSEALSQALLQEGIASLRIAFSGNGQSEGRFADSTITKEVADLGAVLDELQTWRVAYIGHSMGGAVGVLRAAQDARIGALVSLAAVTHTAEFVQRMFGNLEQDDPMLGKAHCPFSLALRSDLMELDTLTPYAPKIRVPWLMVHGTQDEVVPDSHTRDMVRAAEGRATEKLLQGADHSFTGMHLDRLVSTVVPWVTAAFAGDARA